MKLIQSPMVPLTAATGIRRRISLRLLNEIRYLFRKRLRQKTFRHMPVYEIADKMQSPVHMLICRRDIEMAILSAMILNHFGGKGHLFIFHDDGSINRRMEKLLHRYVPGSILISRRMADSTAEQKLSAYPHILAWRSRQVLSLKLIDIPLWAQTERIGYLDSDVLFFGYPQEFMQAFTADTRFNIFNRDISDAYSTSRSVLMEEVGVRTPPCINSGMWVMNKKDFVFDRIEAWLSHRLIRSGLSDYRLEQTLIAMLAGASDYETDYFTSAYDVSFEKSPETSICKHYVGRIRYGYELEGLKFLLNHDLI